MTLGAELIEIHDWLRQSLHRLRADMSSPDGAPGKQARRRDPPPVGQLAGDASQDNAQEVRSELDGLAAILESHFRWEERRIADALNSLGPADVRAEDLFGVSVPPG